MNQEPKKVPLLLGRDKILAENKQILKEQQNAVEPELIIRISRYVIPDFSSAFMKNILKHKEKLKGIKFNDSKNSKISPVEKTLKLITNPIKLKRGIYFFNDILWRINFFYLKCKN